MSEWNRILMFIPRGERLMVLLKDVRKGPFFFLVVGKIPEIVTPSHEEKKHIFFAYAEKDESDVEVVEKLKNYFIQRRLRVYHPSENEDINTKIANGIKNAAVKAPVGQAP